MNRLTIFCGSLFVVGSLTGLSGCSRNASAEAEVSAQKVQKPVAVMTVALGQEDVRRTSTQPATVHAFHKAAIRPRTSGYISQIMADIGDVVKVDSPLAIVDVPEMNEQKEVLKAQIERAKAEEDRASAGIAVAEAGVAAADAQWAQARSELQSVDASLAAAEAEFGRTSDLVERRSIEPRILDEVRKRRDSEVARKAALSSAVASAAAGVVVAKAKQASAEADLKAASADTKIAQKKLNELAVMMNYATLKAPFTGVVTQRTAEPGNRVSESEDSAPLFVVSQVDKVRIRISVPERDAAFVNPGDSVSLSFPSFAEDDGLTAEVTRTSGSLDPGTRMMLVEAEVNNETGRLLPGMFGQARISLDNNANANVLPARAVRFSETGEAYVYALNGNKVSVVNVTTGTDDGTTIEIVSGLESGQKVIDAHLQRFTDGQQVEILDTK